MYGLSILQINPSRPYSCFRHGYLQHIHPGHRRILHAHQRRPPCHPLPGPSQKVPHDHKLPHHIPNILRLCHGGRVLCLRLYLLSCNFWHVLDDNPKFLLHHFLHIVRTACRRHVSAQSEVPHHRAKGVHLHRRRLARVRGPRQPRRHSAPPGTGTLPLRCRLHLACAHHRSRRHLHRDHPQNATQAKAHPEVDAARLPPEQNAPRETPRRRLDAARRHSPHHRGAVSRHWSGDERLPHIRSHADSRIVGRLHQVLPPGGASQFRRQSHHLRLAPPELPEKRGVLLWKVTVCQKDVQC